MDNAHSHLSLGGGAEFDTIRSLIAAWGDRARGIGDDAAILDIPADERLVVSTDACVENVHFRRGWLEPEEIGARAAAAALSDLAAMAATPRGLLLSLAFPETWRDSLVGIARGVGEVAASVSCPIVGGNMTTATELSITTTVLGSGHSLLERGGVQAGDIICVTGRLGGPGAALRAFELGETPAEEYRARFARPVPRIEEATWLAARGAHAAIDISDGLMRDAGHLIAASGVSIHVNQQAVPRLAGITWEDAVESGEEYELLVALPGEPSVKRLAAEFHERFGLSLVPIGRAAAPRHAGQATLEMLEAEAHEDWFV